MKTERILIYVSLLFIIISFAFLYFEQQYLSRVCDIAYTLSLILLILFYLSKKNKWPIIISLIFMLVGGSGIVQLLKLEGAGVIVGLSEFLSYIFIPLLIIESLKSDLKTEIIGLALALIITVYVVIKLFHLLPYEDIYFYYAIIGLILLGFYLDLEYKEDIKRVLIVLGVILFNNILS